MEIFGVGVDVVETKRIESSLARFGQRFLRRVFTESEIAYCDSMPHSARHYAARFAAKEAVSKAFGTGISGGIGWRDIEVQREASGAPFIILHGAAEQLARQKNVSQTFVSLSHSDDYAVANAVIVRETTVYGAP